MTVQEEQKYEQKAYTLTNFPATLKTTIGQQIENINSFNQAYITVSSAVKQLEKWIPNSKSPYIAKEILNAFDKAYEWIYDDEQTACAFIGDALYVLLDVNNRQIRKAEKDNIISLSRKIFDYAGCHIYDYEEL